jgi:hypothetical protein
MRILNYLKAEIETYLDRDYDELSPIELANFVLLAIRIKIFYRCTLQSSNK